MASELPELECGGVHPEFLERIDNSFGKVKSKQSRHGPMNKLLSAIFWRHKWLVKPQVPPYEEESTLEANDFKTGLYGKVQTEGACATFPDFVICSYTSSPCDDVPVLVLKFKPEGVATIVATDALSKYLDKLDGKVRGFLVTGNTVEEVQRSCKLDQINEGDEYRHTRSMKLTSKEFLDCLRDIASG